MYALNAAWLSARERNARHAMPAAEPLPFALRARGAPCVPMRRARVLRACEIRRERAICRARAATFVRLRMRACA